MVLTSLVALAALLPTATPYRLPASGDFTKPSRYALQFEVLPAAGTFAGDEAIAIQVFGTPTAVTLHAIDLDLSRATVEQLGKIWPAKIVPHPETETVELQLPQSLQAGAATVRLSFGAKLRDDLKGLYLVKTKEGEAYAVSQFEATDARRAFPCYDEPLFKATYAVTATVPAGLMAISNGPTLGDTPSKDGKLHTVVFGETTPISSYLVALAVGKFTALEAEVPESKNHVRLRVIAPTGEEKLGRFALQMAQKTIPFYESYFGLPYPYAKLDMVAVPDFDAGGMENAGAIFYRDTALLLDEKVASVQAQKRVGVVVVHEIAHQWFGDLVTMAWWDDLWLNEAFASLMEGKSLEVLHPEWEPWRQVQLDTQDVLVTDSLAATHPIHVAVATADEANALFDDITYSKGAAVLRMLELYLTPKVWQDGVHAYLTAHALGNATEADLWQALSAASGKDVAQVAASWFEQPGYPLVSLTRAGAHLTLSQTPFLVGKPPPGAVEGARWQVPVCLDLPKGRLLAEDCTLLTDRMGRMDLGAAPAWLDANAHQWGFYRVDYGAADWATLTSIFDLQRGQGIDGGERMALLSNAYWLARTDRASLDRLLNIVAKLAKERNFAVWQTALRALGDLDDNLLADRDREAFHALLAHLLRPAAAQVEWVTGPKDTPSRRSLREVVLGGLTALADDPRTVKQARAHLAAFERDPASLDLTLLPLVLASAARHGDAALWQQFRQKMDSAETPELRDRYTAALAEFREPALIQKTLDLILAGGLRKQDVGYELGLMLGLDHGGMSGNPSSRAATLAFLEGHWAELKDRFSGVAAVWSLLPALGGFCDGGTRDQLQRFFADPAHHVEGSERALQQAMERIDQCAHFKEAHAAELAQWIAKSALKRKSARADLR